MIDRMRNAILRQEAVKRRPSLKSAAAAPLPEKKRPPLPPVRSQQKAYATDTAGKKVKLRTAIADSCGTKVKVSVKSVPAILANNRPCTVPPPQPVEPISCSGSSTPSALILADMSNMRPARGVTLVLGSNEAVCGGKFSSQKEVEVVSTRHHGVPMCCARPATVSVISAASILRELVVPAKTRFGGHNALVDPQPRCSVIPTRTRSYSRKSEAKVRIVDPKREIRPRVLRTAKVLARQMADVEENLAHRARTAAGATRRKAEGNDRSVRTSAFKADLRAHRAPPPPIGMTTGHGIF